MATQTTTYSFNIPAVGGDADNWGALLNANWNKLEAILSGADGEPVISVDGLTADGMTLTGVVAMSIDGEVTEKVHTLGTSGAVTIDPANGSIQTLAMTGNVTISSSLTTGQFVTLQISSVGSDSITWPSMQWMYGAEPVLDASATNWIQLWNVGGTLYGSYLGFSS